jgi:hypothetical protein
MAYDPVKALQAAGVLEGPLPPELTSALANLSQDDVDTIISHRSQLPAAAPWIAPSAAPLAAAPVAMACMCGVWSGSGSGKAD